jgi:hypothetical protein
MNQLRHPQQDGAIDATTRLTLTLDAQTWNLIVGHLAETGPWRVVNPIIQELQSQLRLAVASARSASRAGEEAG